MLKTRHIDTLTPPAAGAKITYDHADGDAKSLRGFGVRVTAAGAKAFILNYRIKGQERRITIGSYPAWSVAAARKEALRLRREIDQGRDPLGERVAAREAPTVRDLAARYIEEHAMPKKRPNSVRDDRAMIDRIILPALGVRKVADLRHADIEALHHEVSKTAPFRANRVAALISKMLSLAIGWEFITSNPAKGIDRNPEPPRQRYLDARELVRLSAALAAHPNQRVANLVRLLLLTGARCGEMLAADWSQFDFENGRWVKPNSGTKQKREHWLPLSAPALQLLVGMRATANARFLFPGRFGQRHMAYPKGGWAAVCRAADLDGVRLHG